MAYKPHKLIRDKTIKNKAQGQFWSIFLIEAGLFLAASVLAIASAFELNKLVKAQKIYLPAISLQDFAFSFLFVTFFILFFVFYKKGPKGYPKFKGIIFKGIFVITCFWGGMTCLSLFIPAFGAVLIMGVLIFLWLEMPRVWIHDILMILGLAGAASFFGLGFNPAIVVALLVVLSFYDFIAVYKTKHMLKIAKEMIAQKVVLGFIIPKEIKYFKEKLNQVKPGGGFMILGGGDVVLPNLLAVSVIPSGLLKALVIVVFSLAGCFLSYWLFTNQKGPKGCPEPIPALPPVALLAIIGYFVTLLF